MKAISHEQACLEQPEAMSKLPEKLQKNIYDTIFYYDGTIFIVLDMLTGRRYMWIDWMRKWVK